MRYQSVISKWFEVTSSPMWCILKSKPFQSIDKLSFEIFWHKCEKNAIKDKWSELVLTKKSEKFDFFQFFSNKSYFFCVKLNSMIKMLSFEVLHVEIAQKLQNLKIFTHF